MGVAIVGRLIRWAALGAVLASLGLVVAAIAGLNGQHAGAASVYTIDIIDSGFNPQLCQVNRNGDRIHWKNKTNRTVRIEVLDLGGVDNPPLAESEDILPGQESILVMEVTAPVDRTYRDKYAPEHRGRFTSPIDPGAQASCSPLPPTPTPTPTRTPTPIATPVPRHPSCTGLLPITRAQITGCSVASNISADGPGE